MYGKSFLEVYTSCVEGVSNVAKVAGFNAAFNELEGENDDYESLATAESLYQIVGVKSKLEDVVRGTLTRKDLKDLYEVGMVGLGKSGRVHYDSILLSPRFKKCPYCSLGQATTLDHYLPKCRFPQFSVSVCNLVPSCKDCQSKKGREYASRKSMQTLHPYFDRVAFFSDVWVRARLIRAPNVSVEFYVDAPSAWPQAMRERAEAHFSAHNLAERFGIEAASELISVNESCADLRASGQFKDIEKLLERQAKGYSANCPNSWQSAFYSALSTDGWYCSALSV